MSSVNVAPSQEGNPPCGHPTGARAIFSSGLLWIVAVLFFGLLAGLVCSSPRVARRIVAFRQTVLRSLNLGDSVTPSELRVLSWNVESDGNNPAVIARQLVELGAYDICALQEVHSDNFNRYGTELQQAFGEQYRYFISQTGRDDRLMIAFDSDRLKLLSKQELFEFDGIRLNDWRHRSPLVAHFQHQPTGCEFLCVTVHLARGSAEFRNEQALGLRRWASEQTLPVVAIGDFNMDYHFGRQTGNEALDTFLDRDVWRWVRPEELVDTNYFDGDGDGQDDYPGSMLDFAFVAGAAKYWDLTCRVIQRRDDFPDDEQTADHRPIELIVDRAASD